MRLNQHRQTQGFREEPVVVELLVLQDRGYEQYRGCSKLLRLIDLILVDDEVLPQDRRPHGVGDLLQVEVVSLEEVGFGED